MKTISLLLVLLSIRSYSAEPSSAIPDKRDFPLSSKYKPCDDFHKFVCDEAESSFKLRDDRNRHSFAFSDSAERILEAKKNFFANIKKEKNLPARTQQIKDFYLACMDQGSGKKLEQSYLKKLVAEVSKIKTVDQFKEWQLGNLEKGEFSLISFWTNPNQDRPQVADVIITTDLMNLPEHSYYQNAELMKDYQQLASRFFKIAYPDENEKQANLRADRMIALEKDFVKIFPFPEVQRQRWSERRQQSQKEFQQKYPGIDFSNTFKKLPEATFVFNSIPESLEFLSQKLTAENLDVFKDTVLYKAATAVLDDSQPKYYDEQLQFRFKHLGGPQTRSLRDERCTKLVMSNFPKELDQVMIPKLFPQFPAEKFNQVIEKVRESIIVGLQKNSWLGPESKAKAILKIQKAKLFTIQPKTDKEWDFLPIVKFSAKDKISNSQKFGRNVYKRQIHELTDGVNQEAWGMGPLTVNAYYDPSSNKFVLPLGILQYPFFNADGDLIENLGAVGAVAGHELGHGIDDEGSKYDENGKVNQWMTMKDLAEFGNRGKKLIGFFDKAGHNGRLTLGENIGDLVGLTFAQRAAFSAGKPSVEDQKKLFMAYARLWCYVARPKSEEQQLKTNPHALGWARINEQVKHQKSFIEAFQCKKGDAMYLPESEQVQIW